jgi:hypothetical protein
MQRALGVALFGAALTVAAGAGYSVWRARSASAPLPAALVAAKAPATPQAAAAVGTFVDPLSPDRPVTVDATPREVVGNWVTARPAFQYSRKAAERSGVEPCAIAAGDTSSFDDWTPLAQGHFSAPRGLALDASGHFDLVIHLNGDEPVRRELIESRQNIVLYTFTLDPSRSYAPLFTGTHLFDAIVSGVEHSISKKAGRAAHVGHVALSAWSAGFIGIEAALAQNGSKDVDAVVLIDGLHAPRGDESAFKAQLKPFVDYAARAAAGERFMLVSHSSIDPPDFASTTECAHYLIASLGGKPQPVRRADPLGLELVEYFDRGDFHVRGYAGNDKADHCAQLAVLRDAFGALGRRWTRTPNE